MSTPLWVPTPERIAKSNLARFMAGLESTGTGSCTTYEDLYKWSLARPGDFWSAVARYTGLDIQWNDSPVLENSQDMERARFFPKAQLKFTANLLRHDAALPAIVFRNERGARSQLSYGELTLEVERVARGLVAAGVGQGDRVAGFLPNLPEAVVAALATIRLGAIWSSCSPDFGLQSVLDRFGQIQPKVLFAADGYFYAGKTFESRSLLKDLLPRLPSLVSTILIPYIGTAPETALPAGNCVAWADFGTRAGPCPSPALPFNHPIYILYSSGTTGAPKCIVHGAGGTLLQHVKEHVLHTDIKPGDRLLYVTTCGWMMWNWQVSALASGCSIVLYDGSPFHPADAAIWDLVDQERITALGVSAKYLAALEKKGVRPGSTHGLASLRTLLSTGSPLAPGSFDFTYAHIKSDVHLASISGGTDIISCFALGCPVRPVYRGQLQCRGLGMAVEVFDSQGNSLAHERGELVCTRPFPSAPLGFWSDPDGARYHKAYFSMFPGVWNHGDFAELTAEDGVIISGRSDAVLNPGGIRIGTAEIYAAVESLQEISEAVAIGQDWDNDVRIILFVKLAGGVPELDEALRERIRQTIRRQTTLRHVPAKILAVAEIPRTRSGKISELSVRDAIHGRTSADFSALANPECIALYRDLAELAY
jgi:acetoacetyl-CoA synthetase